MQHSNSLTTWIGLLLAAVGFGIIWRAWDGASNLDYIQGQFPYLISGGITGLGLIVLGVGLLLIEALRRDAARRRDQLERLTAVMRELHALLAPADPYDPSGVGEYRPRPRGNGDEAPTEQIVVRSAGRREA